MKTFARLSLTALASTMVMLLAPHNAHAHGGLVEPLPRAITTMKLDIASTFGHPIAMRADYTNGKGGNCLDFTPDANLKALPTGISKIKMRANDGANHIGPCTVYLVDPRDKTKKVQVGQLNDCMRSLHPGPGNKGNAPIPAEMTIDVPSDMSKLPCDNGHCVLEWYWEATHLDPHEFFNNCADVIIGGGGASDLTSNAGSHNFYAGSHNFYAGPHDAYAGSYNFYAGPHDTYAGPHEPYFTTHNEAYAYAYASSGKEHVHLHRPAPRQCRDDSMVQLELSQLLPLGHVQVAGITRARRYSLHVPRTTRQHVSIHDHRGLHFKCMVGRSP